MMMMMRMLLRVIMKDREKGKVTKKESSKSRNVINCTCYSICSWWKRGFVSHFVLVIGSKPMVKVPAGP